MREVEYMSFEKFKESLDELISNIKKELQYIIENLGSDFSIIEKCPTIYHIGSIAYEMCFTVTTVNIIEHLDIVAMDLELEFSNSKFLAFNHVTMTKKQYSNFKIRIGDDNTIHYKDIQQIS